MTTATLGLADTLKTQTQPAHTAAERHEFQGRLFRGLLGEQAYAALLGQYYLVHKALTNALSKVAADQRVAPIFRPFHVYPQLFETDLQKFAAVPATIKPLPATARIIHEIQHAAPATLIGFIYVAEGSTNGGKFIGQALRRALNRPTGEGLSSLDPHGELQKDRWTAFRSALDGLTLSEADRQAVLAGADRYFGYVLELFGELSGAFPAAPGSLPVTR
ncbi:MAG: biliverdin-producing heme oxygenase [Phycisphaerales bacterium]|nr:biliverdin-producing heme oxygenase [Planctomycetota bacterium]